MADIVICAEQSVTRAGLAAMVTMTGIAIVVDQVDGLRTLSSWLQTGQTDLVVVALSSLSARDVESLLEIVDALPEEERFFVLCLADVGLTEEDSDNPSQVLLAQLMQTSIVSLLPMGVSADELKYAIAAILSGFVVLHPEISEVLFSKTQDTFLAAEPYELESLTLREIQVLNQLANGLTNKAIAQILTISEHTVKFHISAILAKLNATSRTEAVAIGIRAGLVLL